MIQSDAHARILVDAGPGTGKTATACARIAWLISHGGLDPSQIWLISFTRTAVHELRYRIAAYLPDPTEVASLKIATIDSHAWAIQSGFDECASLSGSFENNIQHVIELLKHNEGVFEYLETVGHLVVDEAQDVVGARCELLLEMIHALPRTAGISIFSDEAQAIYGFAEDATSSVIEGNLPEQIKEFMGNEFREMELNQIHRTQDQTLLEIFAEGRKLLRDRGPRGAVRFDGVKELVRTTNHGSLGGYRTDLQQLPDDLNDAFLLFRRRGEALDASSYLGARPHRLRMSGLPTCVHGWIAVMFWDWVEPHIDRSEFDRRWAQRVPPSAIALDEAWATLMASFGRTGGRLSVTKMVTRLAGASPPNDLSTPEFGYQGPVVGTIHGSKGREAAEVRLYLPRSSHGKQDESELEEEARIVFVGATRAKQRLQIGDAASRVVAKKLSPSGRAFTPYLYEKGRPSARARVEIGRVRDVDAAGLAGVHLYESPDEARAAQERVMSFGTGMGGTHAVQNAAKEWRYQVLLDESNQHLFYLSPTINHDLFAIARAVDESVHLGRRLPPNQLKYLHTFGFRTLAVAPDDPMREHLHSPWRESGVLAAPMLLAYPFAYFRWGT